MVEYIYYSGVGAKKNGKHTVEEFLEIMNKHFNIPCSNYLIGLNYKPCAEYEKMDMKDMLKNIRRNKPSMIFNRRKKTQNKYNRLVKQCMKYKKTATNKKQCSLDEYIKFSGADTK
jgi:hypothetical protein